MSGGPHRREVMASGVFGKQGLRILLVVAIGSLGAYLFLYSTIEHWRLANGPWQVTFARSSGMEPMLTIQHPRFHIEHVEILFKGHNSPATNVVHEFNKMQPVPYPVPFGECKFQDLISRPGTVVLEIYGHEIQLMPNSLTIDKHSIPWKSNQRISLD